MTHCALKFQSLARLLCSPRIIFAPLLLLLLPLSARAASIIRFSESAQTFGGNGRSLDVALGDLDGDGDLDAVVANYSTTPNLNFSQIWLNNGDRSFSVSTQKIGSGYSRAVALADLDNDGDLDIFLVEGSPFDPRLGSYQIWLNRGGHPVSFEQNGQTLTTSAVPNAVALGALDSAPGVDAFIVVTGLEDYSDAVLFNDGSGQFRDSRQRWHNENASTVALGDLNGDNDVDVIIGGLTGVDLRLNHRGVPLQPRGIFTTVSQHLGDNLAGGVALGDLDGDGDADIFISNIDGKDAVWINQGNRQNGTAGTFVSTGQTLYTADSRRVALADFDRDGDLDAFVSSGLLNVIYENDGSGHFTDTGIFVGNGSSTAVALGDLDGDGDLDAFVANAPEPNTVWFNTTPRRLGTVPEYEITTFAGNGAAGSGGDGGPASEAQLDRPCGIAVDAQGNVFVAELDSNRVRRVGTNGIITAFAGNGTAGFSGDGGPATNAQLYFTYGSGLAVDFRGNTYIADTANNRIRRIDTNGLISTFAGNGSSLGDGDGGPATNAVVNSPTAIAVDLIGNVYFAASMPTRIRRVDSNGIIQTVAGKDGGIHRDGIVAIQADLGSDVDALAIDSRGNIYIGGVLDVKRRIRRVDANGIIMTIAGIPFSPAGALSILTSVNAPSGLATDNGGNLFFADSNDYRIRRVDTNGLATTIAGAGNPGFSGDGGPARTAALGADGLAIGPDGNVFVIDLSGRRVRQLRPTGVTADLVPQYVSEPPPDSIIDTGRGIFGSALKIRNLGRADIRINSITLDDGPAGFSFVAPDFPQFVRFEDDPLSISILYTNAITSSVTRTLRVNSDPEMPEVSYLCIAEPPVVGAVERVVFTLTRGAASQSTGQTSTPSRERQRVRSLPIETATLYPDINVPISLTTELPSFLGGGTVVISNFTGSVTVSLLPSLDDPDRAAIRIDSGTFTAPSFRLPSGLETGPNTLTFGDPSESGGFLVTSNGSYAASASATIRNTLFPEGIHVKGRYSGIYDPKTGRATVQSESADTFKAVDLLRFTRTPKDFSLTWLPGNILEAANDILGPWTIVSNAVSPRTVDVTRQAREFFRLRFSNQTNQITR